MESRLDWDISQDIVAEIPIEKNYPSAHFAKKKAMRRRIVSTRTSETIETISAPSVAKKAIRWIIAERDWDYASHAEEKDIFQNNVPNSSGTHKERTVMREEL